MGRLKGSKNKIVREKMNPALIKVFNEVLFSKRGRGRPKGSLNKLKASPKTARIVLGKLEFDGCYVCGRVSWGPVQPLGLSKWRHAECYPGSPNWCLEYPEFDPSKKSEAGQFIYESVQQ